MRLSGPRSRSTTFFCSAGNWTRDLWICSQELWPLDHRGGQPLMMTMTIKMIMNNIVMLNKSVLTMNFKVKGLICWRRHAIVSNAVVDSHVTTGDACNVQRVSRYRNSCNRNISSNDLRLPCWWKLAKASWSSVGRTLFYRRCNLNGWVSAANSQAGQAYVVKLHFHFLFPSLCSLSMSKTLYSVLNTCHF
jgi:hypothetical protein